MDTNEHSNTQADVTADKPKVLIADDDKFLLDMYAMKFCEKGFQVVPASGGEEALEALRALGYSQAEARDALRKVPQEIQGGSARLREALKIVGGK